MNRDELSALWALERSMGWKMVQREFSLRREQIAAQVLNPDTPLDRVERLRQVQAGVNEVLSWPRRMMQLEPAEEEPVRAGLMQPPVEED